MSTWYFSSGCELRLLTHQADLQHADMASGVPSTTEELGHGHHEDIWLLTGTLRVALSTLFLSLCSARSVVRGHSVGPHITLMVGYLSAQQSGGALQPGHLGQLEHSSSQHGILDSESLFQWSGWASYVQGLCIHGKVFGNPSILPTAVCSSGLIPQCLVRSQWLSRASSPFFSFIITVWSLQSPSCLDFGPESSSDSNFLKV